MNLFETEITLLRQRLPELEWKLSQIEPIYPSMVPPGLFRRGQELSVWSAADLINDILQDIQGLEQTIAEEMQSFIVQHLSRKIEVLIRLCRTPLRCVSSLTVRQAEALMTREQWLAMLSLKQKKLVDIEHALSARVTHASSAIRPHLDRDLEAIRAQLLFTRMV